MIELAPITPENYAAARELSVQPDQAAFVAGLEKTLADAFVYPDTWFRLITDKAAPVGFVLLHDFADDGRRFLNVVRLMVDAQHQRRGFGTACLRRVFELAGHWERPVDELRISTVPENTVALMLYRRLGFVGTELEDGEIALYRPLS